MGELIGKGGEQKIRFRFPNTLGRIESPVVMEGDEMVKFDGNVALIRKPKEGEELGANGFAPSQMNEVIALQEARDRGAFRIQPLKGTSIGVFIPFVQPLENERVEG